MIHATLNHKKDPIICMHLFPGEIIKEIYSIDGVIDVLFGRYYITNYSRIFSVHGIKIIELCPSIDSYGYKIVNLFNSSCTKENTYKLHRLVMIYFCGIDPERPFVNHKDGQKQNNVITNLEWCTQKENVNHAIVNDLRKRKLTPKIVRGIIKDLNTHKYTNVQLAEKWGTTPGQINHIKQNRYKDIDQHREFEYRTHLTDSEIEEIYNNAANGIGDAMQAKQYNVSLETISLIRLKKLDRYKQVLKDKPPIYRGYSKYKSKEE